MIGRLTRGAYLLILVTIIVAYAVQAAQSSPPEPSQERPPAERMYS